MIHADPSLSVAERIDAACDRFESEWKAGDRPRIEDFLAAVPKSDRDLLRQALLAIELELQGRGAADTSVSRSSVRSGEESTSNATVQHVSGIECAPTTIGRFEIRGTLGSGAFGLVYRARDPQLGREVAIKMPLDAVPTEAERGRFLKEARAAATINHPNICQILEVGESEGRPYIVMALVPGQSLADTIKTRKEPLPEKQAALIVRKIALALAAAHDKGVIHRDLKPANVMFDRERKDVIVMDFGLARSSKLGDAHGTQSGVIMGTPTYMSPEQASGGSKDVGPAGDVFSLGVILYELLTGIRPFTGTATEVIGKILHVEPEPPSQRRPDIDPRLEAVCLRAMAKDPKARFKSMKEFAAAIDAILRAPAPAGPSAETAKENKTRQDGAEPSTGANMADVFAALSIDRRHARAETGAIVDAAIAKHRVPRWYFIATGLFVLTALTTLGGIVFFTRSEKVKVDLTVVLNDVDLHDKSLSFFLDEEPVSAEVLASRVELKPGDHVFTVKRGKEIVKRLLFTVAGGKQPEIKVKDITPTPAVPKSLTPEDEDREFARWLLSVGVQSVTVSVDEEPERGIGKLAEMPAGPFRVTAFDSWGNTKITDRTVDPILRWIERRGVERVSFFANLIGDETVRQLVKLASLKKINLGATKITPACIPDLVPRTDLSALNLQERPIGDADVEKLRGLVNLVELHLNATQVTDAGLKHLRAMKRLRTLALNSTAVTGAGLDELAGLPIEDLALVQTKVRGAESLARLKNLPELKTVHLNGLLLADADLKPLSECKSIEALHLQDNHITDAGLDELAKMKWLKLVRIRVGNWTNPVTTAGVERLRKALPNCNVIYEALALPADPDRTAAELVQSLGGRLTVRVGDNPNVGLNKGDQLPTSPFHVRVVNLGGRKSVTDETLARLCLASLSELTEINLSSTAISDPGLVHLRDAKSLQRIILSRVPIAGPGLAHLAELPQLRYLELDGYPQFTNAGMPHLRQLTRITHLSLSMNFDEINDEGLGQLEALTNLERLELMQTNVSGTAFSRLKGLTKLKSVDVRLAPIDNRGLAAIAALPVLEHLNLEGTKKFSSAGLEAFRDKSTLRVLNLADTEITDAAVPLLATLKGLKELYLGKSKVSAAGIETLDKALPNCRIDSEKRK